MDKKKINEQIMSIVESEADMLTPILDAWFKAHPKEKALKFSEDPSKMPVLHFGSNDSDGYLNFVVKRIEKAEDEGDYRFIVNRFTCAYNDDLDDDDDYCYNIHLGDLTDFLPGELSDLAEFIKKWVDPARSFYETSAHTQAICEFFSAYNKLQKEGVDLIFDMELEKLYFYNATDVKDLSLTDADNGSEVDVERLPNIDFSPFNINYSEDVVYADMKKQNSETLNAK